MHHLSWIAAKTAPPQRMPNELRSRPIAFQGDYLSAGDMQGRVWAGNIADEQSAAALHKESSLGFAPLDDFFCRHLEAPPRNYAIGVGLDQHEVAEVVNGASTPAAFGRH